MGGEPAGSGLTYSYSKQEMQYVCPDPTDLQILLLQRLGRRWGCGTILYTVEILLYSSITYGVTYCGLGNDGTQTPSADMSPERG